MSDATLPWEQRAGEPPIWFDRFTQFCLLGPNRTLDAVSSVMETQRAMHIETLASAKDANAARTIER